MIQPAVAPQGIDAILGALATGGAPMGNLGKLPSPMNPAAIAAPATGPASPSPQMPNMPGMPQAGAMDPLAGAPGSVDPMQLQMILQALLAGGAFNSSTMPG